MKTEIGITIISCLYLEIKQNGFGSSSPMGLIPTPPL